MTLGRWKTYAAQSGYVYQYRLAAKRELAEDGGLEFAFEISSDRKTMHPVLVNVARTAMQAWATERGRELAEPEIHAAAKLCLWQALDRPGIFSSGAEALMVDASNICELLDEIGVD